MRYALAFILVLGALPVRAQVPRSSCAAADSLVGPTKKPPQLRSSLDKLTDTLVLTGKQLDFGTSFLTHDVIGLQLEIRGSGKTPNADSRPFFYLSTFRYGSKTTTTDQRILSDSVVLTFLLDDSVRFRLSEHVGKVRTGNNVMAGDWVGEDFWFPVTEAQVLAIARARSGLAGVAGYRGKLKKEFIQSAADIFRVLVCRKENAGAGAGPLLDRQGSI